MLRKVSVRCGKMIGTKNASSDPYCHNLNEKCLPIQNNRLKARLRQYQECFVAKPCAVGNINQIGKFFLDFEYQLFNAWTRLRSFHMRGDRYRKRIYFRRLEKIILEIEIAGKTSNILEHPTFYPLCGDSSLTFLLGENSCIFLFDLMPQL